MTRLRTLASLLCILIFLVYIPDWTYPPNVVHTKTNYSRLYHDYGNIVDIRIIVMAFNRPKSLEKCLRSFQNVATDGLRVSLEVWIDRDQRTNLIDLDTLDVALDFRWRHGPINVWVHGRHVGLYGQWLYTWRPRIADGLVSMSELALFVEDDVDVSVYGLRWLYAIHGHLQQRDDVACYTLQDENVMLASGYRKLDQDIAKPSDTPVYLYRIPGSWAMAPHPEKWLRFQDWYETARIDDGFHPYVKEAPLNTKWYKQLEKKNRQDTMWTMWFIFFSNKELLFCAYSNLPTYTGRSDVSLSANRKEVGLHYTVSEQTGKKVPVLLTKWNTSFLQFPKEPAMYDYTGKRLDPYVSARYRDDYRH
ncbi:hypothetical protein LSH36_241g02018 [Paralvinella palmiformis]|uniref:Uncharacterized protein n=1 Tax=Paralvinella palmiformis TaxID=53620 RepID=A0AAD9N3I4_9ANNE|nr:hypothetical protein LSH36_241g02018 [Paralvinella palmiformis]